MQPKFFFMVESLWAFRACKVDIVSVFHVLCKLSLAIESLVTMCALVSCWYKGWTRSVVDFHVFSQALFKTKGPGAEWALDWH